MVVQSEMALGLAFPVKNRRSDGTCLDYRDGTTVVIDKTLREPV